MKKKFPAETSVEIPEENIAQEFSQEKSEKEEKKPVIALTESALEKMYAVTDKYIEKGYSVPFPTTEEIEAKILPLYGSGLVDDKDIILFFLWLDTIREELPLRTQGITDRFLTQSVKFV